MKRVPWWVWVSATPFGLGAWTPIIPGRELRRRAWVVWGSVWSGLTFAGWVLALATGGGGAGGGLIILGWAGAVATAIAIRPAYVQAAGSSFTRELGAAELRLQERHQAQALAREKPELAVELGVGRPDRPGAQDEGLVDVNNAGVSALVRLPGVDEALAQRIVALRERINGFESLEDFGEVLDLDGDAVERLRDHIVCLPR